MPPKPKMVACPVCGGAVVLVVSSVFDLEVEPVTGRLNGHKRLKDTASSLSIPTTGSRHGCTTCGQTWTSSQFNRVWRAAGCPLR
jgi:hypothetical protein